MSKKIAEVAGWVVEQVEPGVLVATKDGQRPIQCGGGEGADVAVLRARIFEAIDEVEAGASAPGGMPAAKSGLVGHPAQIVTKE